MGPNPPTCWNEIILEDVRDKNPFLKAKTIADTEGDSLGRLESPKAKTAWALQQDVGFEEPRRDNAPCGQSQQTQIQVRSAKNKHN